MRRKRYHRPGILYEEDDQNPLTGVANLFDIAMVFSVALMIALVMSFQLPELLSPTADITIVKNPGQPDMKIIVKEGQNIEVLNMTDQIGGGTGEALGTAYQLGDGRVVYVPDSGNETGS
ncbi:DUF2149 domain-containing protein [Methanococcoides alaskense]|uniref:DUF2149 domain-containing protein n=1 Tax=Methanococcoides alaskense TaxID=325778 RepID=A0AA90U236_9EURY|nr:DUF2149 domain-containing protein [Methanococcoides alaskense]MDA0524165.1 DUF2149 domain-containing protein [Methanococcoides alaskense]MDR6223844.1 hypothetical protein [Methanococcoides alaskense]